MKKGKKFTVELINEQWYFWDSKGTTSYPYDTKSDAEKALADYEYDMAMEWYCPEE